MSYANNITVAGQSTQIREILGAGGKMKKKTDFHFAISLKQPVQKQ